MSYQKTNKAGLILLTAGITIILCALFFIFFGTRLLIDTAYIAPSGSVSQTDSANESSAEERTTAEAAENESTAAQNSASSNITTASASTSKSASSNKSKASTTAKASKSTTAKMQETQTKKQTTTDTPKITIPGLSAMKIAANSKTAEVDLYNPGKNDCYFKITITLKDGTVLYQSDYVRPGQHIYEIELKSALEKGDYDATLHYDTYSTDGNYTEYNGADVPFTLTAE